MGRKPTKRNNLCVVVPFFGREDVSKIAFSRLKKQAVKYKFTVVACGSEGEKSKKLAEKYGFVYIEHENNPVSLKFQALFDSVKTHDFDGVIVIGSDNLISDSIFDVYSKSDVNTPIVYGVNDVVFYRTSDGKIGSNGAYVDNGMTIGVARMYTKPLLELLKYKLFDQDKNSGIDTIAWAKVSNYSKVIDSKENVILDIKHDSNITSHSIVDTCRNVLDESFLFENFPTEAKQLIELRSKTPEKRQLNGKEMVDVNKVKVEFVQDVLPFFKKGEIVIRNKRIITPLIKRGLAKKVE